MTFCNVEEQMTESNTETFGRVKGSSSKTTSEEDILICKPRCNGKRKDFQDKIRVGQKYQATCPDLLPATSNRANLKEPAILLWSPSTQNSDKDIDEYLRYAANENNYEKDQALGMLQFYNKDIAKAKVGVKKYFSSKPIWTKNEKIIFEQCFALHKKKFGYFRELLPGKSLKDIIQYYYYWKRSKKPEKYLTKTQTVNRITRSATSSSQSITSPAENFSNVPSLNGLLNGDNQLSLNGSPDSHFNSNIQMNSFCAQCGNETALNETHMGLICRNCCKTLENITESANTRRLPDGMHMPLDAIKAFQRGDFKVNAPNELLQLMLRLQAKKQDVERLENQLANERRATTAIANRVPPPNETNQRWTTGEMEMMGIAICEHGPNFSLIAEIIGTKTGAEVRDFYLRNRLRLDGTHLNGVAKACITKQTQPRHSSPVAGTPLANGESSVTVIEISDSEDECNAELPKTNFVCRL